MAKRLICLVLALLMMAVAFTSCSGGGDAIQETVDSASRYTTTLNFWLITESPEIAKVSELMYEGFNAEVDYEHFEDLTDADKEKHAAGKAIYDTLSDTEKAAVAQLGAINKAINKLTKERFKTQIKFRYILESEYYTKLEKAFADREAAKQNGTLVKPSVSQDETVLNEYGIPELKYPVTPDYQVDIMFLDGADRYRDYAKKEWIASLDTVLENSGIQLNYYVNNVLLNSVKYMTSTYAIPNNHTIGEYVYLAVDTELAAAYNYLPDDFGNSLYSKETYDFLNLVYNRADKDVYPLYCDGDVDMESLHYWSFDADCEDGYYTLDPDNFSLFGSYYSSGSTQGAKLEFSNLLSNVLYRSRLERQVYYKTTEGFLAPSAEDKAAVRVVKGGWELKGELEKQGYSVLTVEAPRATDEDVYGSMFAIGNNSSDTGRAMEIITYLNTNAELRNLLQYGVEGVNYTLEVGPDGESVYAKESFDNVYKMDVNKTGNVFVAYPNSVEAIEEWENGKEQNRYVVAYPTVGLYFDMASRKDKTTGQMRDTRVMDEATVRIVNAVSEKFKASVLDQLQSVEQVQALNAELAERRDNTQMATFLLNTLGTVSYTMNGETKEITVESLAAALTAMANTTVPADPASGKVNTMAPGAFWEDWRLNSGVLGDYE